MRYSTIVEKDDKTLLEIIDMLVKGSHGDSPPVSWPEIFHAVSGKSDETIECYILHALTAKS
jgi:hypothetical protein